MQSASSFLKLSPQEVVTDEWEVLDDPGEFGMDDIISIGIGLLLFVIPGMIAIFMALTRPRRRGYLCLTNWRCLYYERGEGLFKNYHHVATTDLDDIVAVHSVYEEGLLGKRSLFIQVYTKYEDKIIIQIGDAGRLLARIPVIGKLFHRNSIGRDALCVPPVLYTFIQDHRADVVESHASF
jgi:hypothetical protein